MTDADNRFDGVSGCLTCDRVNVSNAVHGLAQLISCDESDIDSIGAALGLVEAELSKYASYNEPPEGGSNPIEAARMTRNGL